MRLIVGLGNPGAEYNFTRHNFGFLMLDLYAKIHNLNWQKPKLGAEWLKSGDQIFIKPQDFYNNSGQAVQAFMHFYKIPRENLLVICDDFDLEFGKTRFRERGSSGGNNGLKSIASHLKTTDFARLRLGTGNKPLRERLGDTDFVLGRFTAEEKDQLMPIINDASQKLEDWSRGKTLKV